MMNRPSNTDFAAHWPAGLPDGRFVSVGIGTRWVVLAVLFLATGCGGKPAPPDGIDPKPEQTDSSSDARMLRSVNLGAFQIRETRPLENQKIDLQFVVQAVVSDENRQKLEQFAEQHLHALRDQIIIAVRTAESPDFDEPELKRIRRRMMLRIASVLDEPIVEDIYLTDFRFQTD